MAGDRRRVTVTLDANIGGYTTQLATAAAATKAFSHSLEHASHNGDLLDTEFRSVASRLRLVLDIFGSIGPALVPIGAVAVPAITGMANAFGMAALSGGTAILAFQGVGDALTKVNKAGLDPTEANLKSARLAMSKISEESQEMVRHLGDMQNVMHELSAVSAAGLFPGLNEAMDTLVTQAPKVELILRRVGQATGEMAAAGAEDLASGRWDEFFTFLANEAPKSISSLAHASGNLAHAMAEMWMAFQPLNNDFTDWLNDSTLALDEWAQGLSATEGFQEFVAYIETNGPAVGDTLGAIAMALIHIVEAAAPVGQTILPILEAVANTAAAIADSNFGVPLLALLSLTKTMALFSRTMDVGVARSTRTFASDMRGLAKSHIQLGSAIRGGMMDVNRWNAALVGGMRGLEKYNDRMSRTRATMASLGRSGGVIGGMMLAQSELTEKMHLSNTVMGASIGLMAGWQGALAGGAVGLLGDIAAAADKSTISVESLSEAMIAANSATDITIYQDIATELQRFGTGMDAAGISLQDATSAIVEGGPALDFLITKIDGVIAAQTALQDGALADAGLGMNENDIDDLIKFRNALEGSNGKINEAAGQLHKKQEAQAAAAGADRDAAAAADEFTASLERMRGGLQALDALLEERSLKRDQIQAWKDLRTAMKEALKTNDGINWKKSSKEGLEVWNALDGAVQSTTARIKKYEEANRSGAARSVLEAELKRLRDFKREFPGSAALVDPLIEKLKVLRAKLRALTDEKPPKIKPEVDTDSAVRKLGRFDAEVKKIPPQTMTDIRADNHQALLAVHQTNAALASIDPFVLSVIQIRTEHMDVRLGKPSVAGGGLMIGPGTGTSDSIPANLSNGEFVMRAGAVKKYGVSMFQRLNMAGGGPLGVGPGFPMPGGGGDNPNGFGSDTAGLLGKIVKALLGSNMGKGQIRGLMKELDELQRAIGKHNRSIIRHNKKVDEWNKNHPDEKQRKHKSFELTDELKDQAHELMKEIRNAEKERHRAIKEAFANFDADLTQGAEGIHDQVASLRRSLREAGGVWDKSMQRHADRIENLSAQYDQQAVVLEGQQSVLADLNAAAEATASAMASFVEQVQSHFNNDPFSTPQGLAGAMAQLTTDTVRANAFNTVLQQLKQMGLDGPAFEALAASGDLVTAQQLAASGMIDPFEQAFAERTAALSAVGTMAGNTVFGQQVAEQNVAIANQNQLIASTQATMTSLQAQVVAQTAALYDIAARVDVAIRQGSYDGTYNGIKDGVKGAGQNGGRGSGGWTGGQVWS